MNTRPIESRDVDAILEIQTASPEVAQWTMWDYNRVAGGEMAGWVATEENELLGFLVARRVSGDIEILNFAVRPEARRCGLGGKLLAAVMGWGVAIKAESAMLEVRASNIAALQFYERRGFTVVGRRQRYYMSPVEDALLLNAPVK
ncbi:MAG: ribosomal protein S18-alanine N-acetyltransferase [Candidatus Acidiferrales bacterium]